MNSDNYKELNKNTWNNKVAIHVASDFYNVSDFLKGKNSIPEIDLALLGDIRGKTILHLQCHFGQDTLSLARLGAKCTGIDISNKAIEKALEFNEKLGLDAKFICCDIYDTPKHIDEKFDIIYTSYGTIGWFPDLDKWAKVIAYFFKTWW